MLAVRHSLLMLLVAVGLCPATVSLASSWDSTAVRTFAPETVGSTGPCWTIVQDHRSLMYFGVNDGVLEFDGHTWRMIELPGGLACTALHLGREGRVYVGSDREVGYLAPDERGTIEYVSLQDSLARGVSIFDDVVVEIASIPDHLFFLGERKLLVQGTEGAALHTSDDYFFSMETLGDALFLIDGARGLLRYENRELVPVPGGRDILTPLFLPTSERTILLFSQLLGFVRFTPDAESSARRFEPLPGAEHDLFQDVSPSSALRLKDGFLAVGTFRGGLALLNPEGALAHRVTRADGLPSDDIYSLAQDANGNLWLGTGAGIAVLVPSHQLGSALADTSSPDVDTAAGEADSVVFHASIRMLESTINDSVLFGGAFFRQVRGVVKAEQTENLNLEFPHDYNAFRFTFSSNFLEANLNHEYQTFMEGLEQDWSSWSDRTFREYTNLDWGNYTFHVRARNASGVLSVPATFSFQILPPWWETFWWYSAQVTLLLGLLLISGFLNKAGRGTKVSIFLVTLVVFVVFEYLEVAIEPTIGRYTQGIAFFEVMILVMMGLMLTPIQHWMLKLLAIVTGAKKSAMERLSEQQNKI